MKHNKELLELILDELVDVRRTLVNCNKIEKITGTMTITVNDKVIELDNVNVDKSDILSTLLECRYYFTKLSWYYLYIADITLIVYNHYIADGYDFDNGVETEIIYRNGEWLC